MTTYLIDKKEAKKNKCKYNKLPILRLILFLLSAIILYFVPYFIPLYYSDAIKTIIYIIWIIYLAIGIYKYVKIVKLIKMIEQEAIIKKDDTFYLVRLSSNKEDIVINYKNKFEYIYKTLINNVKQLLDNYDYDARSRKLKKEEYEKALKKGLEKDAKWIITSDLKNNLDVYLKDKKCHIKSRKPHKHYSDSGKIAENKELFENLLEFTNKLYHHNFINREEKLKLKKLIISRDKKMEEFYINFEKDENSSRNQYIQEIKKLIG